MFDKIYIIIKDIIIYVVPGLTTIYCLMLLNHLKISDINVSDSNLLVVLMIAFSFIVGFILSQLQIILFWKIPRKISYSNLKDSSITHVAKTKIIEQAISAFKLSENTKIEKLLVDEKLVELCNDYIKIHGTNDTYSLIERDNYLSSFAISIFIPITLSFYTFLNLKDLVLAPTYLYSILVTIISVLLFFFLLNKIALAFKKGRTNKIFRQFLVLSIMAEDAIKLSGQYTLSLK